MTTAVNCASVADDKKMEWFCDAKLGIFTHFGIYDVTGIEESWSFFNHEITYKDYMKQLSGFTADKYDPKLWATQFAGSGAKYAVLTTKHHDGVALWKGDWKHFNTVDDTPAKRDLVTPFVKCMRDLGVEPCLYFSLIDWSHPDYTGFESGTQRYKIADDPERWKRFLKFYFTQMWELSTQHNPAMFWFDGNWEHTAEEWSAKELHEMLTAKNPNVLCNSRLPGYGDFATPEQGVPVTRPKDKYWELCMTCNDSWGWQPADTNFKSPFQVIAILVDCIGMGGNLLLDCGPKGNGEIPAEEFAILAQLGNWTTKFSTAVFASRAGLPPNHCGYRTGSSKDGTKLFIYIGQSKVTAPITVAGVIGDIDSVVNHGAGTVLKYTKDAKKPNTIHITPPTGDHEWDAQFSVITVTFKAPFTVDNNASWTSSDIMPALLQNKRWMEKHGYSIKDSIAGPSSDHFTAGFTRLSPDKKTLYLMFSGVPNGPIFVKGLNSIVRRIWVVGNATRPMYDIKMQHPPGSGAPGILYIHVPAFAVDDDVTVVAVALVEPIKLYPEDHTAEEYNINNNKYHNGKQLVAASTTDGTVTGRLLWLRRFLSCLAFVVLLAGFLFFNY